MENQNNQSDPNGESKDQDWRTIYKSKEMKKEESKIIKSCEKIIKSESQNPQNEWNSQLGNKPFRLKGVQTKSKEENWKTSGKTETNVSKTFVTTSDVNYSTMNPQDFDKLIQGVLNEKHFTPQKKSPNLNQMPPKKQNIPTTNNIPSPEEIKSYGNDGITKRAYIDWEKKKVELFHEFEKINKKGENFKTFQHVQQESKDEGQGGKKGEVVGQEDKVGGKGELKTILRGCSSQPNYIMNDTSENCKREETKMKNHLKEIQFIVDSCKIRSGKCLSPTQQYLDSSRTKECLSCEVRGEPPNYSTFPKITIEFPVEALSNLGAFYEHKEKLSTPKYLSTASLYINNES